MALFTCLLLNGIFIMGMTHGWHLFPRQAASTESTTQPVPSQTTNPGQESTVAATTVPVGDPNCKDNLTNCLNYGHPSCTGPYEDWARVNCAAFCGFCIPITSPFICEDKINNCNQYGAGLCTNPENDVFVETKCLKYCHRCPGELTSPPPKTGCFDDFERCDEFGKITCTNFPSWAKLYCAKYCDFCASNDTSSEASTTTSAPTSPVATSPLDPDCFDRRDCSDFDIHTSCCGQYEAYSKYNCPVHCKFCTPKVTEAPVCTDKIPNCNQLNGDLCTNERFDKYAAENCAGFCQICNRTQYIPECARGSTTAAAMTTIPPEKKCERNGKSYTKHQTWTTDDCYQSCICQDPETNKITCGRLECPKPKLDCDLIYSIGGCCPVLKCNFIQTIHGEMTQGELAALTGK